MAVLSVRLDSDLESRIEFLLTHKKIVDKSAYFRQLLDKQIQTELIDYVAQQVRIRNCTAWKAAELAHISLYQMLHELAIRDVLSYSLEDLEEDLHAIQSDGA